MQSKLFPVSCLYALSTLWLHPLTAAPTGFQCTHGKAEVTANASATTIRSSGRAIVQWDHFSIGAQEKVVFQQAGAKAAILNRVVGKGTSEILGALTSNGAVYLINPHGVFIGPGAHIETNGFLASTLDVLDADFLKEQQIRFFQNGAAGTIINQGKITAPAGDVFLFAAHIDQQGEVLAEQGQIGLAAGSEIWLSVDAQPKVFIRPGVEGTGTIDHTGHLQAALIDLQAQGSPYACAIKASGQMDAIRITQETGRIVLKADVGALAIDGIMQAGTIHVSAEEIRVLNQAHLDVSGESGGEIWLGGGLQGSSFGMPLAQRVFVHPDARISANGSVENGGNVIIWSEDQTRFAGTITATGITRGGFAEVSSKNALGYTGFANLTSQQGVPGELLLDPQFITIDPGGGAAADYLFCDAPTPGTLSILGSSLGTTLSGGTPISLQANTDVTFQDTVTVIGATPGNLTVQAGRSIAFTAAGIVSMGAANFTATINDTVLAPCDGDRVAGNASFSTVAGASLTSTTGNILIQYGAGTPAGTPEGFVSMNGGTILSTLGTITISGQGYGGLATTPDNTGITMLGNALIESGSSTSPAISLTGIAGGVSVNPAQGISMAGSATVRTTGSGSLEMTGTVPASASTGLSSGISLVGGSTALVESTGAGNILMTGNSQTSDAAVAGNNYGLDINQIIQTTGTGGVTLMGTASPFSTANGNTGVFMLSGAQVNSSGGDIVITGVRGGAGGAGSNAAVEMRGNVQITGTNGAGVTIDATTGQNPTGIQSRGFIMNSLNLLSRILTADGNITINGIGSSGAGNSNYGVFMIGASLSNNGGLRTTGAGNISVTGNGVAGSQAVGIEMENSSIRADGTGNISLIGTSTSTGAGNNRGVSYSLTGAINQVIRAANGSIYIEGHAGGGAASQDNNGVALSGGALVGPHFGTIEVQGPGNLTIIGTSDGTSLNGGNNGVIANVRMRILSTSAAPNAGTITINGTGGLGAVGDNGVLVTGVAPFPSALIESIVGDINITGQGAGNNVSSNGVLVSLGADIRSTGTADINIIGTGANGLTDCNGVHVTGTGSTIESAGTGEIMITGTGGVGTSQDQGVRVSNNGLITSVAGTLSIAGTGGGNALGNNNVGIDVDSGGDIITTGTAQMILLGTGGNGTINKHGIQVSGLLSTITSNSSGVTSLTAFGSTTASSTNQNHGIQVDTSGLILVTAGQATIVGTGGGNGVTGTNNSGIALLSAGDIRSSNNASVDVTGIGGNALTANSGILVDGSGSTLESINTSRMEVVGTGGGNGLALSGSNVGILVRNDGDIRVSDSSEMTVFGTGGNGLTDNHGVQVTGAGSLIFSSSTSDLEVSGNGSTAAAATSLNHGVQIDTSGGIGTSLGALTVMASGGGNGSGNTNIGIEIISQGQVFSTSPSALTLLGLGGNGTADNFGIHTSDLGSGVTSSNGGLIDIRGMHGAATVEDIVIDQFSSILSVTTGNITANALIGDLLVRDGGSIISQDSGEMNIEAQDNVRLEGGINPGEYARIMPTNGETFVRARQGDVSLLGGTGFGSYAQIGNDTIAGVDALGRIIHVRAANDVHVNGNNTNSYALIGHGSPSALFSLNFFTDITVFAHNVFVDGASAGGGGQGFGQIGHVNATGFPMNLTGNIFVDVTNDVILTGGAFDASAYARIGHGGQGGAAPSVSGNILVIADVDIMLNTLVGQAQIDNLGAGTVTAVVDDLFPFRCDYGPGQFVLSAGSLIQTAGGNLRIYTVMPSQNTILELINGSPFNVAPFAVNTVDQTWSTYFPGGGYGGAAFNLYYKVPCELVGVTPDPIFELAVDNSQLVPLLPYYLPVRYENYPYHPMVCIEEKLEEFWHAARRMPPVVDKECEPTFLRSRSEMFENFLR